MKPHLPLNKILHGDALDVLRRLPAGLVHTCVTSPPYWGLRDYGVPQQIGLEETPAEYVIKLVRVFHEIRRVLRPDGTLWLNLGDSYAGSGRGLNADGTPSDRTQAKQGTNRGSLLDLSNRLVAPGATGRAWVAPAAGLKPKDLVGIPWRVAFALQDDGWWLRCDIIWQKPNCMPESVSDRPTRSHEYLFLLSKRRQYYYDGDAILEPYAPSSDVRYWQALRAGRSYAVKPPYRTNTPYAGAYKRGQGRVQSRGNHADGLVVGGARDGRNRRSVWTVPTHPYRGAHFATFPERLVEPCIRAGAPPGGIVLDPFLGSGTTAVVAQRLKRNYIGIELNLEYIRLARLRLEDRDAHGRFA